MCQSKSSTRFDPAGWTRITLNTASPEKRPFVLEAFGQTDTAQGRTSSTQSHGTRVTDVCGRSPEDAKILVKAFLVEGGVQANSRAWHNAMQSENIQRMTHKPEPSSFGGALLTLQSCWSDRRISWCLGGWITCHGNVALACSVSTADLHFTLQVTSLGARALLVHVPAVMAALCSCGLVGQLICHSMEVTSLFPAGCTRSSCIHQRFDALAIWSAELAIAVVFPSVVPHLARPRTFVTVTVILMSCLSLIKLLSFKRMGATDERLRTLQGGRLLKR